MASLPITSSSPSPPSPTALSNPTVLPIDPSAFELLITCNPPILESLLAQLPTASIFCLYQTSALLRDFFSASPTSWRYISWRLYQPSISTAAVTNPSAGQRQSSNYALDQILLNVINPFSTRLVSLELDNTAVSGATLTSTVLVLRRDTLTHVSVRGCKNVSLKYHINPWLQLHALARSHDAPTGHGSPPFGQLALKSLYTYRCRHHRRRPYLPSSLARKESDSEPTHELVLTCHKLGIWTDTAWCTTPGARCYRRRGYVKMRMPQDPREVWVVYDRLWRSRNWLGPSEPIKETSNLPVKKRKRDVRSWEFDEEAINGEPIGTGLEAKPTPAHQRQSHTKFIENIICHNCSAEILERCEQCSVMMHCAGCRKTLCASCAFDRPYLRNKAALEEDKHKFWWAPGCAVSPCSMQDQDLPPPGTVNGVPVANTNTLPNIKLKWCCTEPVFSGGGGITFGGISHRETDQIRAAPLLPGHGWEDPEFNPDRTDTDTVENPLFAPSSQRKSINDTIGGRWSSIDGLFRTAGSLSSGDHHAVSVPRVLCDDCYSSEHWRLKCQACFTSLCLKHDIGDRVKARICGFKDLAVEKQDYKSRQKAIKILAALMRQRKEKALAKAWPESHASGSSIGKTLPSIIATTAPSSSTNAVSSTPEPPTIMFSETASIEAGMENLLRTLHVPMPESEAPLRPSSPASNSSGAISRSTSPTPSTHSNSPTPEPNSVPRRPPRPKMQPIPRWQGCLSVFCPTSRAPGDHRRRCTASMRQCFECKTHICGGCADAFEPPCPCKGCRAPQSQAVPAPHLAAPDSASETPLFFCPNCRWHRMEVGKCKKRSDAFLSAQSLSLKRLKKKKGKLRKPIEERRLSNNMLGGPSSAEEAIDGLVEFFNSLNVQLHGIQAQESSASDVAGSAYDDPLTYANQSDIQELEDMGALARDLIFRIQRLRDQFVPGSLAARALPDIRLQDVAESAEAMHVIAALAEDEANAARPELTGAVEIEPDELLEDGAAGEQMPNTD